MSIFSSLKNLCRRKGQIFKIEYEGNTLVGIIFRPERPNGHFVVYCHAGFNMGDEDDFPESDFLAEQGYTVIVLRYETEGIENISLISDVQEAYDAGRALRNKYQAKGKIFIMGVSRGGFVALHTMINHYDFFDGCICLVGPTSLIELEQTSEIPPFQLSKMMKYFDFKGNRLQSSPITYAEKLAVRPLLLIYGKQDIIVPVQQGKLLADRILSAKYLPVDHGHGLHHERTVQEIVVAWMGQQVKNFG